MKVSKSFDRIQSFEIGLYLSNKVESPPFNKETTNADFQICGISLVVKERLNNYVNGGEII